MSLVKGGVLLNCHPSCSPCPKRSWKGGVGLARGRIDFPLISSFPLFARPESFHPRSRGFHVGAFLFDPTRDPIIKDALKELSCLLLYPSKVERNEEAIILNVISLQIQSVKLVKVKLEPVAFMGGMFAGILRLDLKEDPLREWIARTAEAAGTTNEEEVETGGDMLQEESPQEIEIE